jgi:uncharacterized membrane protein YkvA (DUF1232 family)
LRDIVSKVLSRFGLFRTLVGHARLALRLIREPGVPLVAKAVPFLALAYVISPIDFLPDVFPIVGQLDDLGIVALALQLFIRFCPPAATAFHRDAIAQSRPYSPSTVPGDVIDAEWRRE